MSTPQPQTTERRYQLFIDGQFVDAESGKTFKTPNPATGETFAEVAEADKADVDKAVAAARKATTGKWSKMGARDRRRLRTNHPMEFSSVDGGVETGAGTRRREHGCFEARGANASHRARTGEADSGSWFPGRRGQHHSRLRRDG